MPAPPSGYGGAGYQLNAEIVLVSGVAQFFRRVFEVVTDVLGGIL